MSSSGNPASAAKNFRESWRKFNQALGNFIAKLQLSLLYFTIIAPFGLWTRLTQDPLDLRPKPASTYWRPHSSVTPKSISSDRQ